MVAVYSIAKILYLLVNNGHPLCPPPLLARTPVPSTLVNPHAGPLMPALRALPRYGTIAPRRKLQ